MLEVYRDFVYDWIWALWQNDQTAKLLTTLLVGASVFFVAFALFFILKWISVTVVHRFAVKSKTQWDDVLLKYKVFTKVVHLVPGLIIYSSVSFAEPFYPKLDAYLQNITEVYLLITIVLFVNAMLNSLNDIYNITFSFSKEKPLAGFVQLVKIFVYFSALMALVAILFDKQLWTLFKGLGAAAAVLMLVFKDSLLGFVAGIQIMMNDMVKIDDWIEMRSRGADGSVIEINLTTVKVQNWDKTISMIPTYALITESFVNWRGMEQGNGRRIKRAINIDMNSVRFCNHNMLEEFKKFVLIRDYVSQKQLEIETFNQTLNVSPEDHYNGRRQTNLGVFRKYLEAYLRNNPLINQEMTFLVRHLQPTETGIPLEVYVFCKDKAWANYEGIQADIFDHILAVMPLFGLRVFQNPSGNDLRQLKSQ